MIHLDDLRTDIELADSPEDLASIAITYRAFPTCPERSRRSIRDAIGMAVACALVARDARLRGDVQTAKRWEADRDEHLDAVRRFVDWAGIQLAPSSREDSETAHFACVL